MISYDYPALFITEGTQKELLITDGEVTVSGTTYTVSNETVKFENPDLETEAFELYQSLNSGDQLQFGSCETGKITFSVRKTYNDNIVGVELKVYLIPNHDASKMLQIGVFKVAEDKQTDYYKRHFITAYDAMYDILNKDVTDWYDTILQDEESTCYMDDFRDTFLNQFGVDAETVTLINDGLILRRTIEKDRISGAEIIKAICEINGCFGMITNEGKFRFKSLAKSIAGAADLDHIITSQYSDIEFAEHGFKAIKKVKIIRDNQTIVTSSQTATGDYNTVTIAYNPLIADYNEAELQTVANTLCDALKGHIYIPCTVNAIGNPLHEVGDPIHIATKYNFDILTYIFERRLKGIQALRDTYKANGDEYLSDSLNSSYMQSKSAESQLSQLSKSVENSNIDFVETIRNIGFRLLDEPSDVSVTLNDNNGTVELSWTDPDDISTNEPVSAAWAGTVVVRKENSAPRHRWDGTEIVDSTTRDEYSSSELVDNTIQSNKDYYYGIFPYDTNGYVRYTKVEHVSVGDVYHEPDTWVAKSWSGLSSFYGGSVWQDTDGDIYYSSSSNQYKLNKATSTWEQINWSGVSGLLGSMIWSDGDNTYFSTASKQYVLDKANTAWVQKTWVNPPSTLLGDCVWTDGEHIYYSNGDDQYVLTDKTTGTWTTMTWNGFTKLKGDSIWTDGEHIYYSNTNTYSPNYGQYKLNKATNTWESVTWNIAPEGAYIWKVGNFICYSYGSTQYKFDKTNETWVAKTWQGLTDFYGGAVWVDDDDAYYSSSNNQYELQ